MKASTLVIALLGIISLIPSGVYAAALYGDTSVSATVQLGSDATSTDTYEGIGEPLDDSDSNTTQEASADAAITSDSEVSAEYAHTGRLFGIFEVQVPSETKVMVNATGDVEVKTHMPWWSFFVTGTGKVSAEVDDELSASTSFMADAKASTAAAKARIMDAIAKAHASVDASVR